MFSDNVIEKEQNNDLVFFLNSKNNLHNTIKHNIETKIISKNNENENLSFKKKKLIELCKNLTKLEYLEIFNIIQEDNCQYSENTNGIFINLQNMTENTIDKIFYFIEFIKLKKEDLVKQEEFIDNARKNIITEKIEKQDKSDKNIQIKTENMEYGLSEDDDDDKISNYLIFSSDEDNDIENKISLKKKKPKYSGKKLKMIKSIKDNESFNNKIKNKNKKNEEED